MTKDRCIDLVLFDWNGTLHADTQACMDSANSAIEHFGGKAVPRKEFREKFFFPAIDFYISQGADPAIAGDPEAVKVYHSFYDKLGAKCRTRRGARYVLEWLQGEGIDRAILSNEVGSRIHHHLDRLRLADMIDEVLGNPDCAAANKGNNKFGRVGEYLTKTGHKAARTLIVGDSPEDISIGKRFGMVTAGITDGYFSTAKLRESEPDYVITNLRQLLPIIEEYRND